MCFVILRYGNTTTPVVHQPASLTGLHLWSGLLWGTALAACAATPRFVKAEVQKQLDTNVKPAGLEAFADVRRAIIVAAHADDMETLMAGTILKLRRQGVVFHQLICTAGDIGSNDAAWTRDTLGAARVQEA